MYRIYGRKKGSIGRYKALGKGEFVTNLIYACMFEASDIDKVLETLQEQNPEYEFKKVRV